MSSTPPLVFVSILTYGHESWVMTERVRSLVQASEMRFLRRIEGVTRRVAGFEKGGAFLKE